MRAWIPQLNSPNFSRGAWRHGIGRSFRELLGFTDAVWQEGELPDLELITEEITTKGGGHMKLKKTFDKILHNSRLHTTLRRGMAFAMSLALVVPMVPTFGAGSIQTGPIQATDYPRVEIESNFVRDEFGFLTGYLELGLRVQTPAGKHFERLSVTLEYDTSVLTPVDWEEESSEILISGMDYYKAQLPAAKLEEISTATAFTGIPASGGGEGDGETGGETGDGDNTGMASLAAEDGGETGDSGETGGGETAPTISDAVKNGSKALMTFVVGSRERQTYEEMTTLGVVRFKVSEEEMEKLSITKRSADDYEVNYKYKDDSNTTQIAAVTNIAELAKVAKLRLVGFAADADIKLSNSNVELALDYVAENLVGGTFFSEEYYHVPEYDPDDANTYVKDFTEKLGGKIYSFKDSNWKPKSLNKLLLAVDQAVGDPDQNEKLADKTTPNPNYGLPNRYSFLTNLMVNPEEDYVQHKKNDAGEWEDSGNYIAFTVVSKKSFTAPGDMLGNLTTIVYVDWDNTLLGTQVVPKRTDVRGLVSDFVAENFIYHDEDADSYNEATDINNPAQIAEELTKAGTPTTKEEIVSSLARKYNYRGKYPASTPKPLNPDGSVINDALGTALPNDAYGKNLGEKFPLSNKLDYVFFKRPMTHTDQTAKPDKKAPQYSAENDPDGSQYQADYDAWYWAKTEWSQQLALDIDGNPTTDPLWDTENPYAYGWALCTVDNYQDVWTTLGMGELGSNTPVSEAGAISAGGTMGYTGAASGGYEPNRPAIVSVTYDGDAAFAFADLQKGFTQGTVFLKAVYEPGEDLALLPYRMISEPSYNKLNPSPASAGGAYSVTVHFERSNNMDTGTAGNLQGVARMRAPTGRQQTTTDLKWETDEAHNVNHDLLNPTEGDATSRSKTTYALVPVDNAEDIEVSLTLSARQNKVDYFLTDSYNANYVIGGERTTTNADRTGAAFTVDNYNYFVDGESDTGDPYFDAKLYDDREGTHGFVLYGTLNNIMQRATQRNRGEIGDAGDTGYETAVTENTLKDANLRDATGAVPDLFNVSTFRAVLKDIAAQADNHKNDPAYDCWDPVLDCARLSYHQIQLYILNGGTLLPKATADGDTSTITWCHLHDACASKSAGKPVDWKTLIETARKGDSAAIEMLDLSQAEGISHLRDASGAAFGSITAFSSAVVNAVAALDAAAGGGTQTTIYAWDEVQAQILGETVKDAPSDTYWWYDGATTDVVSNTAGDGVIDGLLTTLKEAIGPAKPAADGSTAAAAGGTTPTPTGRYAKLNALEKAYNDNFAAAAAKPMDTAPAWVAATHNLCGNSNGQPFNTFSDFVTETVRAYDKLKGTYPAPDWYQLQYVILNYAAVDSGVKPLPAPKGQSGAPADYNDYWFYDGGKPIVDLETMLEAAAGNTDSWKNFDQVKWDALKAGTTQEREDFNFAADFAGTPFADVTAFKAAIKIVADNNASNTGIAWEQVQYLIIHAGDAVPPLNGEALIDGTDFTEANAYYWWKGGANPPTLSISTALVQNPMTMGGPDITDLLVALFRVEKNGIPAANSGLLVPGTLKGLRLQNAPADTSNYETNLASDSDIISAITPIIASLRASGTGSDYAPPTNNDLNWFQIQQALLPAGDSTSPDDTGYWWRLMDSQKTPADLALDDILDLMHQVTAGSITTVTGFVTGTAASKLKVAKVKAAGLKTKTGGNFSNQTQVNAQCKTLYYLAKEVQNLSAADRAKVEVNGTLNFTRAELQSAIDAGITATTTPAFLASLLAARPASAALEVELASALSLANVAALTLDAMKTDPALVEKLAADPDYVSALQNQLELVTGKTVELKEPTTTPVVTEKPAEPSPAPAPEASPSPSPAPTPTPSPAPDGDKVYDNDKDVELKGPAADVERDDQVEQDGQVGQDDTDNTDVDTSAPSGEQGELALPADPDKELSGEQDGLALPSDQDTAPPENTSVVTPAPTPPDPTPPDPTPPDPGPLPPMEDTVSFRFLRPIRIYGIAPFSPILANGRTTS